MPRPEVAAPSPRATAYVVLATVVVAALGYVTALPYPFQFDDMPAIVDDPLLRRTGTLTALWHLTPERFVTYATFLANYRLSGPDPLAFRLTNVVLHTLTAILAYFLAARLLRADPTPSEAPSPTPPWLLPALVALVFVAHPLQTQAVTYIHQRFAVLTALLYLSTLLAYVTGRTRRRPGLLVLAFGLALTAMFTKENAATLPLALVLVEALYVFPHERDRKRSVRAVAPFLALLAAVPLTAILRHGAIAARVAQYGEAKLTSFAYFCTQMRVIWLYLRLALFPVGQSLDHDVSVVTSLFDPVTAAAALGLVALLALALWCWRRQRTVAFGLLFFFTALSVESSVLPIRDLAFEHRMYLPLFGLLVALAAAGRALLVKVEARLDRHVLLCVAGVAMVALPLAELTRARNDVWETPITLWRDVVAKAPRKRRGYINLGNALNRDGDREQAAATYAQLLQFAPDDPDGLYELAITDAKLGRPEAPGLLARFEAVAPPHDVRPAYAHGIVALAQGEYAQAEEWLARSVQQADASDVDLARAPFFREAGLALSRLARRRHDLDKANDLLQQLLATYPEDPRLVLEEAGLALEAGQLRVAQAVAQVAARSGGAYAKLAGLTEAAALEAAGERDAAAARYDAVSREVADDPVAATQVAAGLLRLGRRDANAPSSGASSEATCLATAKAMRAEVRLFEATRLVDDALAVCAAQTPVCAAYQALEGERAALIMTYGPPRP